MKVGLYITTLLHDLTQAGFRVQFNSDFEGMVRIDLTKEWDESFYEHDHIGVPGQDREALEKGIIKTLAGWRDSYAKKEGS